MIARYLFEVKASEELPASRAYALYSCLLSYFPAEIAEWFHAQGQTPLAQFLYRDRVTQETYWQVCLLGAEAVTAVSGIMDSLTELQTKIECISLRLLRAEKLTAEELIAQARKLAVSGRVTLHLMSPVAFKQSRHYTILPEPELIVQSLLGKWNSTFPAYPLDDEDARQMLTENLRITDLSIRSSRYELKGTKIPGITGSITLEASLSAPIQEIWNLLVSFSVFSGIGIKTALGMGGITIKPPEIPHKTVLN